MSAADIWAYVTSSGLTAAANLTASQVRAADLHAVHGLGVDALVTTDSSRTAGAVAQTIDEAAGPTITVTRGPVPYVAPGYVNTGYVEP